MDREAKKTAPSAQVEASVSSDVLVLPWWDDEWQEERLVTVFDGAICADVDEWDEAPCEIVVTEDTVKLKLPLNRGDVKH